MNILRLAGELFLIYILYKLIFEFIIPVFQTTKQVRKQFGEMQNKMQDQMNTLKKQQATAKTTTPPPTAKPKPEEYIDYEEVKKK